MANERNADYVKKNEKMSRTETDLYISKMIYKYAYVTDYQSKKRKCDKYKCGQSAVIAFLMEFYDYKNDKLGEIVGFESSRFRDLRSGKHTPCKEVVLKLCLAFNLNYLNSISLLNALGYGLNPQLIFNGNDYFQNDDYYITYFLSTYQKINDEEL